MFSKGKIPPLAILPLLARKQGDESIFTDQYEAFIKF